MKVHLDRWRTGEKEQLLLADQALKIAVFAILLFSGCSIVPEYKTPVSAEHEKEKAKEEKQSEKDLKKEPPGKTNAPQSNGVLYEASLR